MNCPHCQGVLQSLPMVYKSGITTGSSVGINSSLKVGVARHSSISALAEESAPPTAPTPPSISVVPAIGCAIWFCYMPTFGVFFCVLLSGAFAAFGIWRYRQQKAEYLTALYEWQNSYLCLSCGRTFLDD